MQYLRDLPTAEVQWLFWWLWAFGALIVLQIAIIRTRQKHPRDMDDYYVKRMFDGDSLWFVVILLWPVIAVIGTLFVAIALSFCGLGWLWRHVFTRKLF